MATLQSMTVRLGIDTDRLRAGAEQAKKTLAGLGKAVAGLGIGAPAAAAAATAALGLAAGAAAAGLAVKAFSLAAGPQMEKVAEVSKLAEDAQKAAADGASDAAAKQKAYTDALAALPPATRATAKSFIGLKSDYEAWSDSLSGTTMPVFTKGLELMRSLLPTLTPFVKAAAGAFSGFLDDVKTGVQGAGFKQWAADMSAAAGPALRDFLTVIKNLAVGFGGLLGAFLPVSSGMTGGLVKMTGAFAHWGASLKGSAGFAKFLELARAGGGVLGTLGTAALQLFVALSPVIGVTAQLAIWLAQIISAVPPGVLSAIGTGFALVAAGIKLFALYGKLAAVATRIWAAAQWVMNTAMFASPVTWIVLAIVALVAIIVLIATKTTWFQTIWSTVWEAVKSATSASVSAIGSVLHWFAGLPGMIAGWFGAAKDWAIRKFVELTHWLAGLPGRALSALSGLAGSLRNAASRGFNAFKLAATIKALAFVAWARGLPGRIAGAVGNLGSLLVSKGRNLIEGLWNGIKAMGGWIRSKITGWAKAMIPGPIAKALGIHSPSKVMAQQVGRWIPAGVVAGVEGGQPALDRAMSDMVNVPALRQIGSPAGAAQGAETRVSIDLTGGGDAFTRWLREQIRVSGRGDVQRALGTA